MGIDIHVKILHRTEDGNYEYLSVYDKAGNDLGTRAPYCARHSVLFEVLRHDLPARERGLFPHFPEEAREDYMEDDWGFTWFDWCELSAYAENPKYFYPDDDWDEEGNLIEKRVDVLSPWVEEMRFVLGLYNIWWPNPGDVIVQIWFDN